MSIQIFLINSFLYGCCLSQNNVKSGILKNTQAFFLSCRFTVNFNSLICLLQYVFLQNRTSFLAYFSCSCSSCTRPLSRIPHTPGYDLRDTASNNHYLTSSQILSTNSHRNTHLRSGREKTCL